MRSRHLSCGGMQGRGDPLMTHRTRRPSLLLRLYAWLFGTREAL